MQQRIINASTTFIFLICLCFTCFLGQSSQLERLESTKQEELESILIIDNQLSVVKNQLHKTTLAYNSYMDSCIEDYLEQENLANTSLGIRYVSGSCVNFRSQPSLDSEVIDKLYRNAQLELLNEYVGDFYRVRYNGSVGYMHKDYLSETEIKIEAPPKVDYSYIGNLQERVASIAKNNQGTQPCIHGYCAKWVSGIYEAAGLGYPGGNAIDFWIRWSSSGSTSMDNIPVGAIVVGSGSDSDLGNQYGHVGIYIGNGMVAENIGYHRIISLDEWAIKNDGYCQGYHGYIGWVWPYGQAF